MWQSQAATNQILQSIECACQPFDPTAIKCLCHMGDAMAGVLLAMLSADLRHSVLQGPMVACSLADAGVESTRGVGVHHETRAAARDMRDDRFAAMYLGDRTEIDGERQIDLLALAQAEIAGLNVNTRRTQVDCTAQFFAPTGHRDVNRGACPMASMQTTFQTERLAGSVLIHFAVGPFCQYAFAKRPRYCNST
jgi:hypothetical protein